MALLFMDGFDAGDHALKWTSVTSYVESSTVTRFGAGRSIRIVNGAWSATKTFEASDEVIVGFAFRTGSLTTDEVIRFTGSATHVLVGVTSTGRLSVWRGTTATVLATSETDVISANSWNYLEIKVTIDDVSGYVEVRCNGVTVLTYTGDTRNGGTTSVINIITVTSNSSSNSYIDDLYVCNALGSAPYNDFLGDVRVASLVPNAVGNTTQFSATGDNYTHVDELPYSATDYVSGAGTGTKDTYTMSDLPTGATTIFGLQTNVIAKKSDAGNMSLAPVLRSGTTDYVGTVTALGSSDLSLGNLYETDPATSTAWTESSVNSHEAGMEVA